MATGLGGAAVATLDGWREGDPLARLAILTQLVTGIRFSELRALEKQDLDLPRAPAEELRAWMLRVPGQRLFAGRRGGPLANNILNRCYVALCTEAKVDRISSHGARHTAGSSYALAGVGQKMIAGCSGTRTPPPPSATLTSRPGATAELVEARWARFGGAKAE